MGRAAHRGKGDSRPGAGSIAPPIKQMEQMSLGTGDTKTRKEQEMVYNEPKTRPARITDKRGMT